MTQDRNSLLDDMNSHFDSLLEDADRQMSREDAYEQEQYQKTTEVLDKTAIGSVVDAVGGAIAAPNVQRVAKDPVALFDEKVRNLGYNLDEAQAILEEPGTILVNACAGAGKTTMLMLKILRGLLSGALMKVETVQLPNGKVHRMQVVSKILVCTFLKSGALELQREFADWAARLGFKGIDYGNIKFSTIHKEVKDALSDMNVRVEVSELSDNDSFIRACMLETGVRSSLVHSKKITIEEVNDVASIIAYARNRLDGERYMHPQMMTYGLNNVLLDHMIEQYKRQRSATGKMDFEDMQETLLDGARTNAYVEQFLANRYDHIFLDEFQDTSHLQYEMLMYYFRGCKTVMAIGDDDQTIYSWRGSDIRIIQERFIKDFAPRVMPLTVNYRCPSNILRPVVSSIQLNPGRLPKDLRSYKQGGSLRKVYSRDVNILIRSIKEDIANNRTVAVLARTNAELLIPAIILELDGTTKFMVGNSVNMNGKLPRQVFRTMQLVTKRVTDEFVPLLQQFLPRSEQRQADKLVQVLKANKALNLYTIPEMDLKKSVPALWPLLDGLRKAVASSRLEGYLYLLAVMVKNVFTSGTSYARKGREMANFVRQLILHHDQLKDMDLDELEETFLVNLNDQLSKRAAYSEGTRVILTTAHDAKGKGWDSVYIWNDVDGSFPARVGNREPTPKEIQEERRVHYIAWTRAKQNLMVFTEEGNESPFLKECNFDVAEDAEVIHPIDDNVGSKVVYTREPEQVVRYTSDYLEMYLEGLSESDAGLEDGRVADMEWLVSLYTAKYKTKSQAHHHLGLALGAYLQENDYTLDDETYSELIASFIAVKAAETESEDQL